MIELTWMELRDVKKFDEPALCRWKYLTLS